MDVGKHCRRPPNITLNHYWKRKAFHKLGGWKCQCCEEWRIPFLTIDHIQGGGITHRKKFNGQTSFYKWIVDTTEDLSGLLQVLCMNCNWGKRYDKDCPHTLDLPREQTREMALALEEEIADLTVERDRLRGQVMALQPVVVQEVVVPAGQILIRHIAPLDWKEFEQPHPGDYTPSDNGAKVQSIVAQA